MIESVKCLGQSNPNTNTLTAVYTVPAASSAVVSSVVVCNQSNWPGSFRLSLAVGGLTDDPKQYLYFDQSVPAKQSFVATLGITMSAADVLRFLANNGQMSINVSGVETT